MFSNLIESGSHRADLKRRGRFFLGTTLFYALLLAATGVGSIYAYNAKLDDANDYEVYALLRFTPAEARPEPERRAESRPAASNSREQTIASRTVISINTPYHSDRVAPPDAVDIRANVPVVISTVNTDPKGGGGPASTDYADGPPSGPGTGVGPAVRETDTTPPPPAHAAPTPAPTPAQRPSTVHLTSSVLTSKALSKPAPPYPAIAKQVGVQGSVAVQVLIDEQGRVVSAKATSGHPMLQAAAVQAAYKAVFTPTLLTGQPVKVTGVITYNFVLDR
jgi:periplasmic protein TonB